MKALVTSGGTKIFLDDVRYIGNISKGGFGAKIVMALLNQSFGQATVYHVKARDAEDIHPYWQFTDKYQMTNYVTYDDYDKAVRAAVSEEPDIVFLAAAVSDYGVDKTDGKISSSGPVSLTLKPLPKIIDQVKGWSKKPIVQVGFKLTAGMDMVSTINIAREAGQKAKSDFTIANDMSNLGVKYVIDHKTNIFEVFPISTQDDVNDMVEYILRESGINNHVHRFLKLPL